MEAPLYNLITRLLNHPTTTVAVNRNTIIDGFALVNKQLNIQLNIFSDKYNSIYFELYSYWQKEGTGFKFEPNYRLNDFKEFKPLLKTILDKFDSQPIEELDVSQYVQLWKKVLRGEPLSDGFICEENSYHYYLKKDNYHLSSMEKKSITGSLISLADSPQEPLALLKNSFRIAQNKPSYFNFPLYIPKYDAKNYPLLNSNYKFDNPVLKDPSQRYKRNNHLCSSLDDWINKLMENQDVKNCELFNLLQYEQLSLSLNVNNETKGKKIKL
jgi:hypothetical protein